MPKVSVIVPICNVEQYLNKCIDSILEQTLRDIEIICVDDGSTDDSPQILDDYARMDNRIKVIHKENAGYGAAMNTGMDVATGEYIGIVESDDCILPQMYERLYQVAIDHDLDLVKADAFYWLEKYDYLNRIHVQAVDEYYDRVLSEGDRSVFYKFYMNTWTGIYKRCFLEENQIRHHETPGASYQDNGFWMQTLYYCKRAMWLNEAYYLYRQDNPTASVKSKNKMYAMRDEYQWLGELFESKGDLGALPYVNYYRLSRHRGTFMRIADELRRGFCETIKKDYENYAGCLKSEDELTLWMQKVVANPDDVCMNYNHVRATIQQQLERAPYIMMYGTGKVSRWMFRLLYNMGYLDKLKCFVESDTPVERAKWTIPVCSIEEVKDNIVDAQVIVAVSVQGMAYQAISDLLRQYGVESWLIVPVLGEHFYMV
ncbi:MAG: glycosyltransferase [Lachnospiraceae bacterium]|nr:glycosyltransferase [Lachnospiraceae bacterium]